MDSTLTRVPFPSKERYQVREYYHQKPEMDRVFSCYRWSDYSSTWEWMGEGFSFKTLEESKAALDNLVKHNPITYAYSF